MSAAQAGYQYDFLFILIAYSRIKNHIGNKELLNSYNLLLC